jgi:hypothetical protein
MSQKGEEPKIFIDSDWKEEARREKEELDRQTRQVAGGEQIPGPSLLEIVQMVVMQASIGLGGFEDPQTGRRIPPNLPLAKHYIDLLELLHQKTLPNLEQDEKQVIEATMHELRMAFVQIAGGGAEKPPAGGAQSDAANR